MMNVDTDVWLKKLRTDKGGIGSLLMYYLMKILLNKNIYHIMWTRFLAGYTARVLGAGLSI